MTTYVLRNGELVLKSYAPPKSGVQIIGDLKPYKSPICDANGVHPLIDGRTAQREDLKRHGCRIKEPSERLSVAGPPKPPEMRVSQDMMRTMARVYERMRDDR
jgi:hypothetical protein